MRYIIIVGGIVLTALAVSRFLRGRRSGPMRRARKDMQRAVGDVEEALKDLATRAKKLRGEARETVDVQIRALEGRRHDLMERLNAVAAETRNRAKRTRAAAAGS